ncbi:MAG: cytochrome-c peroxidase [Planctomycetes bacterium]|nr:cytochrome-c peroxidase [Planctomycetota bacterium]
MVTPWLIALAASGWAQTGSSAGPRPTVPPLSTPLGLPSPELTLESRGDELATLGARLFFDSILSADRTVACASCHRPERGFADDVTFSLGAHGRQTARNTPTLLNRVYGSHFMWDGRASSLAEQVLLPIENPLEMDLPLEQALARLRAEAGYATEFERVLGSAPARDGLARALAAYVRRLVLGDSPVDRFRAGDFAALDDEARAGLWFYESRGGCWRCHGGANFSDEDFHATGVGARPGEGGAVEPEPGRAAVTGRTEDRGRFKTPTLRGVAATAPYMHDGSLTTLEEVVEFYRLGGRANANLDPLLAPLEMSTSDARNLVAFLRALSVEGR